MKIAPICGIYQLKCATSGRLYVGSSLNIETRIATHLKALRAGKHANDRLQRDFSERGERAFEASVLEVCPASVRLNREQYWIDLKKPYYNLSPVARQKHVSRDEPVKIEHIVVSTGRKPPSTGAGKTSPRPRAKTPPKKRVPKNV